LTEIDVKSSIEIDEKIFTTPLPGFALVTNFIKPSMEKFYCEIFKPKVPSLLKGSFQLSLNFINLL
jgi:hypothetical protein